MKNWKPKDKEHYFYFHSLDTKPFFAIKVTMKGNNPEYDTKAIEMCNYFKTRELAQIGYEAILETLKNLKHS